MNEARGNVGDYDGCDTRECHYVPVDAVGYCEKQNEGNGQSCKLYRGYESGLTLGVTEVVDQRADNDRLHHKAAVADDRQRVNG